MFGKNFKSATMPVLMIYLMIYLMVYLLADSCTVSANGAPVALSPSNIGEIMPVHNDDICIVSEKITYSNLRKRGKYRTMDSRIEYALKNNSSTAQNIKVLFPFDNPLNDFDIEVEFNIKSLDVGILDNIDYFETFKIERYNTEHGWRDPKTVFFDLKMEGNQTGLLVITYTHFSGFSGNDSVFYYYLQPAKYWADYKDLSIIVELPDNYSFTANLDFALQKKSLFENVFVYSSETLPQNDLRFIVSPAGISRMHVLIFFIIFVVFLSAYLFGNKLKNKGYPST